MAAPTDSPTTLLETARRAAEAAAAVHRDAARLAPSSWTEKGRSDFVTEVDMQAEGRIVEILLGDFPDHRILAEEGSVAPAPGRTGGSEPEAGAAGEAGGPVRWIIDPLDGTTNWLHGYPEYAVSIAAVDGNGLAAGVVLNSATGELFEAARGHGARRDGDPIRVSELEELRLALVGTGFPFKQLDVLPAYLDTFSTVLRSTSGIRRAGSAALDLCDVACGRLDAFFEFHLMPWDVAAGALMVREAGGWFEPLAVAGLREEDGDPVVPGLPVGGFVAGGPGLREPFSSLLPG
ncbi:MAG: inositol monophosphatase family protein [Gemmatimonadota bacterium]